MKTQHLVPFLLVLPFAQLACKNDEPLGPSLALLPPNEPAVGSEEARLQQLQAIRVVSADGSLELKTSAQFKAMVEVACSQPVSDHKCNTLRDTLKAKVCQAELLLDAASGDRDVMLSDFTDSEADDVTVPPQPTAAKAALAELAIDANVAAMHSARDTLLADRTQHSCWQSPPDEVSGEINNGVLAFAASTFVTSYYDAKEAYDIAVQSTLAVSDAQRGSTPSLDLALARAISGPALSRAAAAHLLVGGIPGFLGSTSEAFCAQSRLPAPGKAALDVFREAGVAPDDVLASPTALSIESLVNDAGSAVSGGSVKQRLGDLWGVTIPSGNDVQDYYGLKLRDFEQARTALAQEIDIFGRSRTAKLPKQALAGGALPQYERFAATATPPLERDRAYWQALALTESRGVTQEFGGTWVQYFLRFAGSNVLPSVPVQSAQPTKSLGFLTDFAYSWAEHLSGLSSLQAFPDVTRALRALATGTDRVGRISHCLVFSRQGGGDLGINDQIVANGFTSGDKLTYVLGDDELQCAVSGSIEGVPCALGTLPSFQVQGSGNAYYKPKGFQAGRNAQLVELPATGITGRRLYVLRARPGRDGTRPGDWEAVAGFVPYRTTPTPAFAGLPDFMQILCSDVPVVPEALSRVADVLAPSREWCGNSATDCAGFPIDDRLPLEDELSDDGDDVESSWKRYLALAKQAAEEADLLGQDYLKSTLAVDQREEDLSIRKQAQKEKAALEIEVLQQICGTTVDVVPLLKAVSQGTGDNDLADLGDGWLSKLATAPGAQELKECVTRFASVSPYMHLGDAELCAWTDSAGSLCGGSVSGSRCPDLAKQGVPCPAPAGGTPIRISPEEGLRFFSTVDTIPPPPPENACDRIRELRANPAGIDEERKGQLRKVVESNFLNPEALKPLRQRIEFETLYNNYVAINVDGAAKYATGRSVTGPNLGKWPCNGVVRSRTVPPPMPASCARGTGLFCTAFECRSEDGLRAANDRLFQAALGAYFSTFVAGEPKIAIKIPTDLHNGAQPLHATRDAIAVSGVPIARVVNDRWTLFDGAVDPNHPAALAHTLGRAAPGRWNLNPAQGVEFAIGSYSLPDGLPGAMAKYWGGMSQDGLPEGYFRKILANGSQGVGNPGAGRNVLLAIDEVNNSGDPFEVIACLSACEDALLVPASCDCLNDSRGRRVRPMNYTYGHDERSLLDGLELLCAVSQGVSEAGCSLAEPPAMRTMGDLDRVGSYLRCLGDEIQHRAATAVFRNFPTDALDAIRRNGNGTFEPIGGAMGTAVSQLVSALLNVAKSGPVIGRTIRNFGADMKALRETVAIYDVNDRIADVQFEAARVEQIASCLTASAAAFSVDNPWAGGAAAAVTCANTIAQIGFADQLRDLDQEQGQHEREVAIADFNRRFSDHVATLDAEALQLRDSMEIVNRQIGAIADLKSEAQRAVDKALWHLSFQAERQAEIGNALRATRATARTRYSRALQTAKRMAFLAKRAVEQRLGLTLAELTDELPLVAAPATWQSGICATTGIDYNQIDNGKSFADAFIGDYVTKLENVVESYRLVENFHEGSDMVVASLRDDIVGVREECEVESRNLLYYASRLGRVSALRDASEVGWITEGCTEDAGGAPLPCVRIQPLDEAPFVDAAVDRRAARGFRIYFHDELPGKRTLVQYVPLEAGRHRFSWHTSDSGVASTRAGAVVTDPSGQAVAFVAQGQVAGDASSWHRPYVLFDVPVPGTYRVGFQAPSAQAELLVAAPMLERVDNITGVESSLEPKMFSDTTDSRVNRLSVCEDRGGDVFRAKSWTRGCAWLCSNGFASDCTENATKHCYFETSFHVSQWAIERGKLFKLGGFARGNFNYRIESIALNFVGTGLRECEDSNLPSTCFSAGYIPYSLEHAGPYFVRNHLGDDFQARLFTGQIEHARGLGTERYLTNPLSDADRTLIEPYLRKELLGRPLDGTFVLRVWDEPGVAFDRIEDVQILINYRYWTRFD